MDIGTPHTSPTSSSVEKASTEAVTSAPKCSICLDVVEEGVILCACSSDSQDSKNKRIKENAEAKLPAQDASSSAEDQQGDEHGPSCRECLTSYVQSRLDSAFMGSCPALYCPSCLAGGDKTSREAAAAAGKKRKRTLLLYERWKHVLPKQLSTKYSKLASSLLAFLCGGCHILKTLDIGEEITSDSHETSKDSLKKFFAKSGAAEQTLIDLRATLFEYLSGALSVEEFYKSIIDGCFSPLLSMPDDEAWAVFRNLLKMISDPERRANLHLRYLRDRPRIRTRCCNKEHCFRCKVKDYHDGRSCIESSANLDHSVVACPTCGISLAKGDGCNSVTCVCGKQFSWSAEKENSDRCIEFYRTYPTDTSLKCAELLCTIRPTVVTASSSNAARRRSRRDEVAYRSESGAEVSMALVQQAKAWQIRNRTDVSLSLRDWFKTKYWPCPSQCCVVLPMDDLPDGIREGAQVWRNSHAAEVEKCSRETSVAVRALFLSLYPDPLERAAAAHRLVNGPRKDLPSNLNDAHLIKSASAWIAEHRSEFAKGVEDAEVRSAQQFLYLYGNRPPHTTIPARLHCPFATEWCRATSNQDLTFSNSNTTVERVGSISCYPAAFAQLVADRALFKVRVEHAPRTSNWFTFGIARTGMQSSSSDGVGRSPNSWGLADDRSSSSPPQLFANGVTVGEFRKIVPGDILCAVVDTVDGWCEVSMNEQEYSHRFSIPVGTREEYCFAMTFANDHRVSILCDNVLPPSHRGGVCPLTSSANASSSSFSPSSAFPPPPPSSSSSSSSAAAAAPVLGKVNFVVELNPDHTIMLNNFKKQLKILLEDEDDLAHHRNGTAPSNKSSPLITSPEIWVDMCGGAKAASEIYDRLKYDFEAFVNANPHISAAQEQPLKELSEKFDLTWAKMLHAASWYRENRLLVNEMHDTQLAYTFYLTHAEDAPFIAAMTLVDTNASAVQSEEVKAAFAFMKFYAEEMQEWYDYDAQASEPVLENVARGCRCLPRHIRRCPHHDR